MDTHNYELQKNKEENKPVVLNKELTRGFHLNNAPSKDYLKYLQSAKWKKKRKEAIETYESCVLCGTKKSLEVHHRTYVNLKNEDILKDLILLCDRCHSKYHYWKSDRKRQNRKRRKKKKKLIVWRG